MSPPEQKLGILKSHWYGWIILAMAFYLFFTGLGISFYAYGVLLKALVDDFSDSPRLAVSSAIPIMFFFYTCAAPFVGHVTSKYPLKHLLLCGAGIMAAGFMLMSQATALWQCNVIYGVTMGLALSLTGPITISALISHWFVRRRGMAMGIAACGSASMGIIAPMIQAPIISEYGWRTLCLIYGSGVLLLVLPAIWLLVVDQPEQMGVLPDGGKQQPMAPTGPEGESAWTYRLLLRQMNFWRYTIPMATGFGMVNVVVTQTYTQATDVGLTLEQAGLVMSILTGTIFVGKLSVGWLADMVNKRTAFIIIVIFQAAGIAMYAQETSYATLVIGAAMFAFGYGGQATMYGDLAAALFGRHAVGRVLGIAEVPSYMLGVLTVLFATWMFDQTGSYVAAYRYFLGLYVVSLISVLLLRIPVTVPLVPRRL